MNAPPGPPRRFYVEDDDVDAVLADYRARLDAEGEIELMVLPRNAPSAFRPAPDEPVPLAIALLDLLDSADARERHVAAELLDLARGAVRSMV